MGKLRACEIVIKVVAHDDLSIPDIYLRNMIKEELRNRKSERLCEACLKCSSLSTVESRDYTNGMQDIGEQVSCTARAYKSEQSEGSEPHRAYKAMYGNKRYVLCPDGKTAFTAPEGERRHEVVYHLRNDDASVADTYHDGLFGSW
jgi:hypothetical protein